MDSFLLPIAIIYALAVCVFTPFVMRATNKTFSQSAYFSFLLQGISVTAYILLFAAIGALLFACTHHAVRITHVFVPSFFCSLITVFPLASISARKLLHLEEKKQQREVLVGNSTVAILLWIACWCLPF